MRVRDYSFGGGAVFQKKGVGTSQISLDYITTAPPPNLTRLLHNIPPATQATQIGELVRRLPSFHTVSQCVTPK